MENASKALIMAAEVLVGVMIISIGVYLFNTMGAYSATTAEEMEQTRIDIFNQQFLKYYGTSNIEGGNIEPIKCTIHEIIGLANLANKINKQNGFTQVETASDDSLYIQIDLKIGAKTYRNIEALEQDQLVKFIKDNSIIYTYEGNEKKAETKFFKCGEEPKVGAHSKLVNYMKFVEI